MDDDMDQLLKNLRLKRIHQILDREVERATKKQAPYTELLSRLLREQYQYKQDRSVAYRIRQAKLPEEWTLETFPFKRQPGVKAPEFRPLWFRERKINEL